MTTKPFGRIGRSHTKLKHQPTQVTLGMLFIMIVFISASTRMGFAFWTVRHPQHHQITELVQWPGHNDLFLKYSGNMGTWSEEPDKHKDWLFGHGDERSRARNSFKAAIRHYQRYRNDKTKSKELQVAARCLAHAYHYFEDMGDFSEGNERLRNTVTAQLTSLDKRSPLRRAQIESMKRNIQPDLESIFRALNNLKRRNISDQEGDKVRDALLEIVACLEQANKCALAGQGVKRDRQLHVEKGLERGRRGEGHRPTGPDVHTGTKSGSHHPQSSSTHTPSPPAGHKQPTPDAHKTESPPKGRSH
jgi:hypothetical protein